jgi:hypothetical protein
MFGQQYVQGTIERTQLVDKQSDKKGEDWMSGVFIFFHHRFTNWWFSMRMLRLEM